MSFFSDLLGGGVEGLAKGAGQFAKDIRTAITGKEPLTAQQISDIAARADALEAAAQNLESQASKGQIDLNLADAQSGSTYKGGWRPLIGWTCAGGLIYTFLFRPICWWVIQICVMISGSSLVIPELPALDIKELMALTFCLLGFGGFRMYERLKDKA